MSTYGSGTFNGPDGSPAADPLDLIDYGTALATLAAGGVALGDQQAASLPLLITAASREIQKELHRVIPAADYDEILTPTQGRPDRGIPATVNLSHYPVNTSEGQRVSAGRTAALTVVNTGMLSNQVARVAFTTTGDPEQQLCYTGLLLTTVAVGTRTATPLPWPLASPFMTLDALAASINGLGLGWSATVTGGFGSWPTTELVGAREAKGAFSPGATLDVFATDVSSYSIDRAAGILSIGYATAGGGWFGGAFGGYPGNSWGDGDDEASGVASGYDQVRVTYNAGYTTVPSVFQQFTAEVIKVMLERLRTDTLLQGESAKDYSYTARAVLSTTHLQTILTALGKWKDYSL